MWNCPLLVDVSLGGGILIHNILTYLVLVSTEIARNSCFLDDFHIDLT